MRMSGEDQYSCANNIVDALNPIQVDFTPVTGTLGDPVPHDCFV